MQLKGPDYLEGQAIRQEIGGDVQGGIGQVKGVDIDACPLPRLVPGFVDRGTLEYRNERVGRGLATHDNEHHVGQARQPWVTESQVEREDGCLDKPQTGVVEDRTDVNSLLSVELDRARKGRAQ